MKLFDLFRFVRSCNTSNSVAICCDLLIFVLFSQDANVSSMAAHMAHMAQPTQVPTQGPRNKLEDVGSVGTWEQM